MLVSRFLPGFLIGLPGKLKLGLPFLPFLAGLMGSGLRTRIILKGGGFVSFDRDWPVPLPWLGLEGGFGGRGVDGPARGQGLPALGGRRAPGRGGGGLAPGLPVHSNKGINYG
jgi:hypothetical protein